MSNKDTTDDYPPGTPTADEITKAHDVLRRLTHLYLVPGTDTWSGIVEGARCLSVCGLELWGLELWKDDDD